jgi:hypothetical protein
MNNDTGPAQPGTRNPPPAPKCILLESQMPLTVVLDKLETIGFKPADEFMAMIYREIAFRATRCPSGWVRLPCGNICWVRKGAVPGTVWIALSREHLPFVSREPAPPAPPEELDFPDSPPPSQRTRKRPREPVPEPVPVPEPEPAVGDDLLQLLSGEFPTSPTQMPPEPVLEPDPETIPENPSKKTR